MNQSNEDRAYTRQMLGCGALLIFTALANQGWTPYIPGVTFGGHGFWAGIIGFSYGLSLIVWCVRLLLKAKRRFINQRQFGIGAVSATLFWLLTCVGYVFVPSRAELSYRLWRDEFHALVRSGIAQHAQDTQGPVTEIARPADRPWRFGRSITVSEVKVGVLEAGVSSTKTNQVVVFNYGYAVASLVFNSGDVATSHRNSLLCSIYASRSSELKRLEENWFLCAELGPRIDA